VTPAQRLARLPWCWRGGMRYRLSPTHPWTRYDGDDASDGDGNPCRESEPTMRSPLVQIDLTDPATVGCLAAWAREVRGDPCLYAVCVPGEEPGDADSWHIREPLRYGSRSVSPASFATEGDAWAAAILAKLEQP